MEKINSAICYKWYALYVKSRAEKKAHAELQFKEIETFLPLQRRLRQWSDRKKWVEMPLIPGYLFVRISRKEHDSVLQSNFIVNFIKFEGAAAVIPDNQIDYLKLMLKQENPDIEITYETFAYGQMIEVISGPLIGLHGKLVRIKGKNKVAIELEQIGYSVMVEMLAENIRFSGNKEMCR
ncbi:MAG: UpxY family transcription antiterminator [Bacteroidota bacterium]|nr:antitermination protein NusG [Odoribacter sp.]MDP3645349.1 UpxY family transcription antiterminator [Bacteroidota bacterium]